VLRRAKENQIVRNCGKKRTVFLFFPYALGFFQAASRKKSRTFSKKSRTFLKKSPTVFKKHARGSIFSLWNEKKECGFFFRTIFTARFRGRTISHLQGSRKFPAVTKTAL